LVFFLVVRVCVPVSGVFSLSVVLGLYKIFFHSFLWVQESIIPVLPPPIFITHTAAILLHDVCAI